MQMSAEEIKNIRRMLGMSQERLARELGVSFCTVNRWERAKTAPSPMAIEKLSELKEKLTSSLAESSRFVNRRGFIRMLSEFPIKVEPVNPAMGSSKSDTFDACTRDLGLGGLRFFSDRIFTPGSKLRLYIELSRDETPVELSTAVRWAHTNSEGNDIGVQFDDIPTGGLDKLKTALLSPSQGVC